MNKIYRIIWNNSLNVWQCVSELAKGRGKGKSQHSGETTNSAGIKFVLSSLVLAMGTISYQAAAEEVTIAGAPGVSGTVAQVTDPSKYKESSIFTSGTRTKPGSTVYITKNDTITIDGAKGAVNSSIVKFFYEMGWGRNTAAHTLDPNQKYIGSISLGNASDTAHLVVQNSSDKVAFVYDNTGKSTYNDSVRLLLSSLYIGARGNTDASTLVVDNAYFRSISPGKSGILLGLADTAEIRNNSNLSTVYLRNIGNVEVKSSTLEITQSITTLADTTRAQYYNGRADQLGTITFVGNSTLHSESRHLDSGPVQDGGFRSNLVLKDDTNIKVTNSIVNGETVERAFIQNGGVIRDAVGVSAAVNKTGPGTLIYTSANTYTGKTNVKEGTLQLGNENYQPTLDSSNSANNFAYAGGKNIDGSTNEENGKHGSIVSSSDIVMSLGTTLRVQRSNEYHLDNKILGENWDKDPSAGKGNLVQAGSGTTIISNKNNNFSGDTLIRGGVLQFENIESIGRGNTAISTGIKETVTSGDGTTEVDKKGKLRINFSDSATLSRNINGIGEFENSNPSSTVIYTGAGTYTGKTTVSGGTFEIASGGFIIGTSDVLIHTGKHYATDSNVATLIVDGTLETAQPDNNYGDVVMNNGTLTVKNNGTVNVGNIKSTDAKTADQDKSTVTVEDGGNLITNLVSGDTLFENFKTDPGNEGIQINGTLTAQVADKDATISQEDSAVLSGNGTFVKDGNGTLKLASGNNIGTTWVKDGTLDLEPTKTLTTAAVKVGNNKVADEIEKESAKTATFNVLGSVEGATDVSVDSDGYLTIGNDAKVGSISTKKLTVEGGTVDIVKGSTTVSETTSVQDGTLNVGKDTTFTTQDLKAGDNEDKLNSNNKTNAFVNINGTVNASGTVTIKPDAAVNVGTNDTDGVTGDIGKLTAQNLTIDGGMFDVNKGTARVNNETMVNDGTMTIDENTSFSAGPENGTPKDIVLNGGTLNVAGDVNAKNFTSNVAFTDDVNAVVDVKFGGKLNLSPTEGDILFKGFSHDDNDMIGVSGELNITVADNDTTVSQARTAQIKAGTDGTAGTLNKLGEGDLELTSAKNTLDTTNIKDGLIKVKEGAGLDSNQIVVGFKTPDMNGDDETPTTRDGLVVDGKVKSKSLTVNDAQLNVGKTGTFTATEEAILNRGEITIAGDTSNKGTFNIGKVDDEGHLIVPKDFKLNSGTVTVDGTFTAQNMTSNAAKVERNMGEDAFLKIGSTGVVSLKPVANDTLFEGFDTTKGDGVNVGGELFVDVVDGKVIQNINASIAPLNGVGEKEPIKGKLTKAGDGELMLTAGNELGETLIKDGMLSVDTGAALDSTTVNIGDSIEAENTAKLNIRGGALMATDIYVKPDGYFIVDSHNPDSQSGTVNTTNLTVDSGTVDITKGVTTVTHTKINDGLVNVGDNGVFTSDTVVIGDNPDRTPDKGAENSARLNITGQAITTNVIVNPDGYTKVGKDNNDGNFVTVNLTLDGGSVDVDNGQLVATTTIINDGTINVNDDGNLIAADLTVGNNDGPAEKDAAKLNIKGSVIATTVRAKEDATVNVGENAQENNVANGGTLRTTNINVNGGTVNVNEGTTTAEVTNIDDGVVNVDKGAILNGGNIKAGDSINILGTAALNTSGTVNADKLTVHPDAAINVGTNDIPATEDGTTPLIAGDIGILNAKNFTMDGGSLDVNKGTVTTEKATVNNGILTVDKEGTVNVAEILTEDTNSDTTPIPKTLILNGGVLDVTGKVNAENIVSNIPTPGDIDAVIKVRQEGTLALKPTGGKTLFSGFKKGDLDTIEVGGKLTVDVANNVKVEQNPNAPINPLTSDKGAVKGILEKTNDGSLWLSALENAVDKTLINDGILGIKPDSVLTSGTVNIGDKIEGPDTAILNIEGGLKATDVNVRLDGHINIGMNEDSEANKLNIKGKLTADNVTLDGGRVDLNNGEVDIDTTQINKGMVTVDSGTTFDSDTINVGNNTNNNGDPVAEAGIQVDGTVMVKNVTVNPDGMLDVGIDNHTQTGVLQANKLVLEGGPANINSGTVDTSHDIVVNGTTLTIDEGATVTAPNVITTDPMVDDHKASHVEIAGTLNLSPVDGAKLFDNFQTNPSRNPKDGLTINPTGVVNITTPKDGVVIQNPDTPIVGLGTINKKGLGELNVRADNVFEGTVNVDEGVLRFIDQGRLAQATVNVNDGGTLVVDAPTTEVKNLNMMPRGRLAVKVTPESESELRINGTGHLDGQFFVDVKEFKDSPDLDKVDLSRAVISASDKLTGAFSSYDDNSNLFNFIPDYSQPKVVKFIIQPDKDDLRTIANRQGYDQAKNLASVLDSAFAKDSTSSLARLFYSIRDDKGSMEALEQTLPALAGATTKVIGDESRRLARTTPRYVCHPDYEQNEKRAWGRASGHWDYLSADSGASGYSGDYYQLAMGTDKCFWDNTLRLGVMAGYTKGHIRASGNSSYTLMQNELIQLGIYGNRLSKNRKYNIDFSLGYGFASAHHTRNIDFANRKAHASYDSNLWYTGLGLNYHRGNYTPYIRADFQQVRNNAYREKGADILNLHVDKQVANSLLLTAGVEYDHKINDQWKIGGQLAASYEVLGHNNIAKAQLEGAQNMTFKSPAARYSRLSGLAEIKMEYHIKPHTSLKVNYSIQGNRRYRSSNVDLTLRIHY